jgi:hypothetical protein
VTGNGRGQLWNDIDRLVDIVGESVLSTELSVAFSISDVNCPRMAHSPGASCVVLGRPGRGGSVRSDFTEGSTTFGDVYHGIDHVTLCNCVTGMHIRSGRNAPNKARACALGCVLWLCEYLDSYTKHLKRRSKSGALLGDKRDLSRALQKLEEIGLSELLVDEIIVVEGIVASAEMALADLDTRLRGSDLRNQTLDRIKVALVGKSTARHYAFDETPTLVAVEAYRESDWDTASRQVFAQFFVRSEPGGVVAVVPAFVSAFLLSRPKSLSNRLVTPVVLSCNDLGAVCDLAVGLWEPEGAGEMASLCGALEVARAITAASVDVGIERLVANACTESKG